MRAACPAYSGRMNRPETESDYCRRRAAEERAAAAHAADERAAKSHRDLAAHFEGLAGQSVPMRSADEPRSSILAGEFRIIP